MTVRLDDSATVGDGQVVRFGERRLQRVQVELGPTSTPPGADPAPVGVAELGLRDAGGNPVITDEIVRLPVALVRGLGEASLDQPLSVVLSRRRGDPSDPGRFEEEPTLVRRFELPTGRTFTLTGRASGPDPGPACRSDLLGVDGVAVPVSLRPSTAGGFDVTECGPLRLGPGTHLVRTARGGADLDQVVLSSSPGGRAALSGPDGRPVPATTGAQALPASSSRTSVQTTSRLGGASWVVLGQSRNDGWDPSIRGEGRLGRPVLVNGYANGVTVDAAAGTGLDFDWGPQRAVTASLWLAFAGLVACAAAVARGRRWVPAAVAPEPALGLGPASGGPARTSSTAGVSGRVAVGAAALSAVVAGLVVGPWWGLAAAVAAAVAAATSRARLALAAAGSGLVVAALGWVLVARAVERDEQAYAFFTSLEGPHRLALLGLVLLGVGALATERDALGAVGADPVTSLGRWWARARRSRQSARRSTAATGSASPRDRRRFALGCLTGGLPALAAFTWLAGSATGGLFGRRALGGFYDAQAHALADGHLDVPRAALGIEAFTVGGRSYMYQGPFPALVRLPVAVVTDRFDGRLTGASMVLAFAVTIVSVSALSWQVRGLLRPGVAVSRGEAAAAGAFVAACTAGSAPLFLASQLSVYHESALWGAALTLAALAVLTRHLRSPSPAALAAASALSTAALWSRASVALGAVAALGLLGLRDLVQAARAPEARAKRPAPGPGGARRCRPAACGVRLSQPGQVRQPGVGALERPGPEPGELGAPGVPRRQRRHVLRVALRAHHRAGIPAPRRRVAPGAVPLGWLPHRGHR